MNTAIPLEEIEIYKLAIEVGEDVWNIVSEWGYFEKTTIGSQFVRASDSIAANIAEGYGRFFYKDRKQFCYYSRGSILETKTWAAKALNRNLISDEIFEMLVKKLKVLHLKLNIYIKKLKENSDNNI